MQGSMRSEQEPQNTQSNTVKESQDSSNELVQKKDIDGTPFQMIRKTDSETGKETYFVGFGRYRMTRQHPTQEETLKELETESWNVVLKMLGVLIPGEIAVQLAMQKVDKEETEEELKTKDV